MASSFVIYVTLFWLIIYVVKRLRLRRASSAAARAQLLHDDEERALRIGIGRITLETERLNWLFQLIGGTSRRRRFWKRFFAIGGFVTCIAMWPATLLFGAMLARHLQELYAKLAPIAPPSRVAIVATPPPQALQALTTAATASLGFGSRAASRLTGDDTVAAGASSSSSSWLPQLRALVPGVNVRFIIRLIICGIEYG